MLVDVSVRKTIIFRKLYMMSVATSRCFLCSSQTGTPAFVSGYLSCGIYFVGPAIETLDKPVGEFPLLNT